MIKTDNKGIIRIFSILNIFISILIALNIIMYTNVLLDKYHFISPYYLTGIIIFFVLITSKSGNQFFSIDTKGETITFNTKNVGFLSFLGANENKIDLPKSKLVKYEYRNMIISRYITLYVDTKKNPNNLKKIKFRLNFVSSKNINKILGELEKIIITNKKNNDNQDVVI